MTPPEIRVSERPRTCRQSSEGCWTGLEPDVRGGEAASPPAAVMGGGYLVAAPRAIERSEDARWAYEMKWDGMRAIGYVQDGTTRLLSRNDLDVSVNYPEVLDPSEPVRQHSLVAAGARRPRRVEHATEA